MTSLYAKQLEIQDMLKQWQAESSSGFRIKQCKSQEEFKKFDESLEDDDGHQLSIVS